MKRILIASIVCGLFLYSIPGSLFAGSFSLKADQYEKHAFSVNKLYTTQSEYSRAKKPLIIVGASLLGGIYIASIAIDHIYEPDVVFDELYIPVIGPFLAIANYDDNVNPNYSGADFDKSLFLISGLLQTTGAVLLITGLTKNYEPGSPVFDTGRFLSRLSVASTRNKGFRLGYRFGI